MNQRREGDSDADKRVVLFTRSSKKLKLLWLAILCHLFRVGLRLMDEIEQPCCTSRAPEEYAVETRAAIAARKLRDAGVPIHPGESVGYVIADAKAKDKAQRISIGGDGEALHYDLEEYVKRLRDAGKEVSPFPLPKQKNGSRT